MPTGFDPPVYPDARKALFGNWLSSQTFTDLFHGTDGEGRRFAFYEGNLTRKQGKNTVTIFSGQMYAFQRRSRASGEIVIVPDRGLFNFFKPLSRHGAGQVRERPRFREEVRGLCLSTARGDEPARHRRSPQAARASPGGRVFAYVGPEDAFVAATGKNKFEAGSMFRATAGEERVRRMFDEVCDSLAICAR